jgi:hypothetical protein
MPDLDARLGGDVAEAAIAIISIAQQEIPIGMGQREFLRAHLKIKPTAFSSVHRPGILLSPSNCSISAPEIPLSPIPISKPPFSKRKPVPLIG